MTKASVKLYQDKAGDWRWQVKASGRITGASSEGYRRKVDCTTNMHRLSMALSDPIKWSKDNEG